MFVGFFTCYMYQRNYVPTNQENVGYPRTLTTMNKNDSTEFVLYYYFFFIRSPIKKKKILSHPVKLWLLFRLFMLNDILARGTYQVTIQKWNKDDFNNLWIDKSLLIVLMSDCTIWIMQYKHYHSSAY